jgi:hypothetical protein
VWPVPVGGGRRQMFASHWDGCRLAVPSPLPAQVSCVLCRVRPSLYVKHTSIRVCAGSGERSMQPWAKQQEQGSAEVLIECSIGSTLRGNPHLRLLLILAAIAFIQQARRVPLFLFFNWLSLLLTHSFTETPTLPCSLAHPFLAPGPPRLVYQSRAPSWQHQKGRARAAAA